MKVTTRGFALPCAALMAIAVAPRARADSVPAWMRAVASAPLPSHDEKTLAVLLYAEDASIVRPDGKIKSIERRVYKILRPEGRDYGIAVAYFDSNTKITGMHGWCLPQQGKEYEVQEKDALDMSLTRVVLSELVSDQKDRVLRIPAADPGNVVGYEIDTEGHPYISQDRWMFQENVPVREARYTLQLPDGWEYKATWLNHPEVAPAAIGPNQWQWVVRDVPEIRAEDRMPPFRGLAGQLVVSLFQPSGAQSRRLLSWDDIGKWEAGLASDRRAASPEIKQKVAQLAAPAATPLLKMEALAEFVQRDIRYVAIELGIGGWQPHPAPEVFTHRYGDCKDKATLLGAMLEEIGIDSYAIDINGTRGGVNSQTPPTPFLFNHTILAIRLPEGVNDPSLQAVIQHPKLGRLLIFDPTDDLTPLGQLSGALQKNYGLLVMPEGGDLLEIPQLSPETSGISRSAKVSLDYSGNLRGDFVDIRRGDFAAAQREELRSATKDADKIKPIEGLLAGSLADFRITHAVVTNPDQISLPLAYQYSIVAPNYAKTAGNLAIVRPRLIGTRSSDLLETKELRKYPVEFEGPEKDMDRFEITLPPGYVPDDLPSPVDADYSFASYHSKTEVRGNVLIYTRTFEIKQLSVPLSEVEELKKLYGIIAGDERNTAVLKPAAE